MSPLPHLVRPHKMQLHLDDEDLKEFVLPSKSPWPNMNHGNYQQRKNQMERVNKKKMESENVHMTDQAFLL